MRRAHAVVGPPPFAARPLLHGFVEADGLDAVLEGAPSVKVRAMAMHPTRDWVASSDGAQRVSVWDYTERRAVRMFSVPAVVAACVGEGAADDAFFAERGGRMVPSAAPLSASAAKFIGQGGSVPRAAAAAVAPSSAAFEAGEVQAVLFHDMDAVRWGAGCSAREAALAATRSSGAKRRVPAGAWTVAVCANALVFVESELGRTRVVPRHEIVLAGSDGASAPPSELTCAASLSARIVAIGCADGTVRLYDVARGHAACVLSAFARAARVVALSAFCGPAPKNSTSVRLVAAAADGGAAAWMLQITGNVVVGASR